MGYRMVKGHANNGETYETISALHNNFHLCMKHCYIGLLNMLHQTSETLFCLIIKPKIILARHSVIIKYIYIFLCVL